MENRNLVRGLLAAALFAATPAFAFQYTVTLIDIPATAVQPYAINNQGQVAGSITAGGFSRAFSWETGVGTLIDGNSSSAYGINNSGQIVGRGSATSSFNAALWDAGTTTALGTLGGTSIAYDINNQGQVVGYSQSVQVGSFQRTRATLWENGTLTELGSLSQNSQAFAINNNGDIAGYSYQTAGNSIPTLWSNGNIINLGTLGGIHGQARDINDLGQIVGTSNLSGNNATHATLWENGNIIDLGTLTGAGSSYAFGINNIGQIVGESNGFATLWQDGNIFNLNDLIDPALGWTLREARDINTSGQIVGWGSMTGSGNTFGFILTPVPEPSTYAMLALGLGLVGWSTRRQQKRA
ncbi:PEP-CTERM sorting domain-containing protein [Methylobacillus sp.]|uniref:PEP-CTERM sorting domain-containing protein n=1 Tax=Methylobacillus sp. TaxID=56818 RepID=UPI002FE01306